MEDIENSHTTPLESPVQIVPQIILSVNSLLMLGSEGHTDTLVTEICTVFLSFGLHCAHKTKAKERNRIALSLLSGKICNSRDMQAWKRELR